MYSFNCGFKNLSLNLFDVVYAGQPRELEGKIYVVTALIWYLTVLLEYIDFGAISRVGPRAKCPSCPPLSAALGLCNLVIYITT